MSSRDGRPYALRVLAAAHRAADELDEWGGHPSTSLGGCSPGGVVRHAVHEALGVGIDDCPACYADSASSRARNALLRAEETLGRLDAIHREQRARMQPLSRAEKWRAIWWGFTHPFADPRKMRTDR